MRRFYSLALVLVAAACGTTEQGTPILPGSVNAPPPPLAPAPPLSADEFVGSPPPATSVTGVTWAWQKSTRNGATVAPEHPDRYTLEFFPSNRMVLRADCNRGGSDYSVEGKKIILSGLSVSKITCPPGSKDGEAKDNAFLADVRQASQYELKDGELTLFLQSEGGKMLFRPRPPLTIPTPARPPN
jgi:heat shock protein HslJ